MTAASHLETARVGGPTHVESPRRRFTVLIVGGGNAASASRPDWPARSRLARWP